jgi:hypothetical protein
MVDIDYEHSLDMVIFKEFNSTIRELQNNFLENLTPI